VTVCVLCILLDPCVNKTKSTKYYAVGTVLKYYAVGTVPKSNKKIIEIGNIDTPNAQIHDCSLF
jgi:hypothetical protein